MVWLACPRCGRRPLEEFTFGGERRRVPDWIGDPDERDFDEVWIFENPDGVTTEALVPHVRLPPLADRPARRERGPGPRGVALTGLAHRSFEMVLRNRVRFGVEAIEALPELVRSVGRGRAFVVTDPGVAASGVIDRVRGVLAGAGIPVEVYAQVEPNPGTTSVLRGSAALTGFGLESAAIVPVGGGSSMDSAKVISLHAANGGDVLALAWDRPELVAGGPVIAVPTTAGTGAETNTFGVITDESAGRKGYVGHPSLLPVWTILDPALTVGLPRAATAATGVDALTHSLEIAPVGEPQPLRRGDVAPGHPHGGGVAAPGRR
ncbi:MAG: iron-containing alcohol dehydrogenase [Candidatus Limnocylindrales bacterium]